MRAFGGSKGVNCAVSRWTVLERGRKPRDRQRSARGSSDKEEGSGRGKERKYLYRSGDIDEVLCGGGNDSAESLLFARVLVRDGGSQLHTVRQRS
jgi:hypothetical protein